MADEWLRADQVAALVAGIARWGASATAIDALVAQDGRWRALVGALLAALLEAGAAAPHQPALRSACPRCRWLIVAAEAQAALAGAGG